MTDRTGHCLCGAVTFILHNAGDVMDVCHCGMCRRWAAGPTMMVEGHDIEIKGEDSLGVYGSSEWAERGFCKTCGTSLFYRLRGEESLIFVSAGALDDMSDLPLGREICIDSKPDGYSFAGDRIRLTEAEVFAAAGQSDTGDAQ